MWRAGSSAAKGRPAQWMASGARTMTLAGSTWRARPRRRELVDVAGEREGARRGDAGDEVGGVAAPAWPRARSGGRRSRAGGDVDGAVAGGELVAAGADVEGRGARDAQAGAGQGGRRGARGRRTRRRRRRRAGAARGRRRRGSGPVDAEPRQRREDVLDGPDAAGRRRAADGGRPGRGGDLEPVEGDLDAPASEAHGPVGCGGADAGRRARCAAPPPRR